MFVTFPFLYTAMTETYFFNIADETEPTKVITVETDSGPTEPFSSGKKVLCDEIMFKQNNNT